LLESFAYNLCQGFDPLRPAVRRLVATSGGARSPLWRQIVADVLDAPLEYHPQSGGPLGSAFLAGYAAGLIDDFMAIKQRWLCQAETTLPDPAAVACYRQLFPLYETFDQALAEPFARLTRELPAIPSGTP
jgi:xylulokinase